MIDIQMTVKMDEDESIECQCCGKEHKIKLKDICISVGQCEDCEMEVIIIPASIEEGTKQ